jgi:hypothetical protein
MTKNPPPAVAEWLVHLKAQGKSEATISTYRRALAHFATWSEQRYGRPFDPAAIIPGDVTDWNAYQQAVEKIQ